MTVSYQIKFPNVSKEEEIHYIRQQAQRVGAFLNSDGGTITMNSPVESGGLSWDDQLKSRSVLVSLVGDYLREWRRNEVISFLWTCTGLGLEPVAEGFVVSSDGQSTIGLKGLTEQRKAQVYKIYEPNHGEEYHRFVRAIGKPRNCPVTMLLIRDSVTPRKVRVAMADPYELHSITKKIWCGTDITALEPAGPAQEWHRNEEPGMAVVALLNTNSSVDHDANKFVDLLRTYDHSKNPRRDEEESKFMQRCMINRFFGRPFMLGPRGIFPGDAVVL